MVYRKDEKEKMDLLLEMFRPFIREQNYFDIVYSEKIGYLRVVLGNDLIDDLVFRVPDFDMLLRMLVDDMISERMHPNFNSAPSPVDFEEVRRLCKSKLCFTPKEEQHCMELIDACIASWKQESLFY